MFLGTLLLCFSFVCLSNHSKVVIVNNSTDGQESSESPIAHSDSTVEPSGTSEASTAPSCPEGKNQ
jgi:hypothetical protein